MKYCSKCGKELLDEAVVCPGCGCATEKTVTAPQKEKPESKGWFIGGLISLILGVIIAFLINVYIGAVIILVAEILFASARTKINNYAKSQNPSMNKKELKSKIKEIESEDKIAKGCHIMMVVSFCFMLFVLFLPDLLAVLLL